MGFRIEGKFCFLSLTFLCTALAVYADPSHVCPPSELIEPCTCNKACSIPSACSISILCEDIADQEILSRVFTVEYKYNYFSLTQASVLYLPDSLFEVRGLDILTIEDASFVSLFNHTTTEDNSIDSMFLDKVQILRGFDWRVLAGFRSLRRLDMRKVKVAKIDQSFVDNAARSLMYVEIDDCSTATIHDEAFAGLPELTHVFVRSNKIKELKRSMFPSYSKLWEFDFSYNRISTLPDDIFQLMPHLMTINLKGNLLTTYSQSVFDQMLPTLRVIHVEDNPIKCQCDVKWITLVWKVYTIHGSCLEPKALHGRSIHDLTPGDFNHC